MNKILKIFLLSLLLFSFSSCKNEILEKSIKDKNNNKLNEIEYPTYNIEEYNKMDKYEISKNINNIKYKYTYFFKENMCVNSKEELIFNTNVNAKVFYEENKSGEEYMEININNNKVTYYYNPEYFEYLMYPKDILIELLNSNEFDE